MLPLDQQIIAITIIAALAWSISHLKRLLNLLYLWQTKEYRFDRMQAFRQTLAGKNFYDHWGQIYRELYLLASLGYLLAAHLIFQNTDGQIDAQSNLGQFIMLGAGFIVILSLGLLLVWLYETSQLLRQLTRRLLRRPRINTTSLSLLTAPIFLTVAALLPLILLWPWSLLDFSQLHPFFISILGLIYTIPAFIITHSALVIFYNNGELSLLPVIYAFFWVSLDLLQVPLITFLVWLLQPLRSFRQNRIIKKAHQKLANHGPLTIIGITGSYGKSSTKELLAGLLEDHYQIFKTPKNHNTLIGVAQALLQGLNPQTQILIIEMGAYTKHEIRDICQLTPPDISIITGLGAQHLGLFGHTIQDIMKAKYEIVTHMRATQKLPPKSTKADSTLSKIPPTLILHADNKYLQTMLEWARQEKHLQADNIFTYSTKNQYQTKKHPTSLLAINIQEKTDHTGFQLLNQNITSYLETDSNNSPPQKTELAKENDKNTNKEKDTTTKDTTTKDTTTKDTTTKDTTTKDTTTKDTTKESKDTATQEPPTPKHQEKKKDHHQKTPKKPLTKDKDNTKNDQEDKKSPSSSTSHEPKKTASTNNNSPQASSTPKKKSSKKKKTRALSTAQTQTVSSQKLQDLPHFNLKIPGRHQVTNLLAALAVSLRLGINIQDLQKKTSTLQLPGKLEQIKGLKEATIINDSYSSNPDGFLAALELLDKIPGKRKIVITAGMQELGELSRQKHQEIGYKISQTVDLLLLTSRDYELGLREGLGQTPHSKTQTIIQPDPIQASHFLQDTLLSSDIILIEGRLPKAIIKLLLDEQNSTPSCPNPTDCPPS